MCLLTADNQGRLGHSRTGNNEEGKPVDWLRVADVGDRVGLKVVGIGVVGDVRTMVELKGEKFLLTPLPLFLSALSLFGQKPRMEAFCGSAVFAFGVRAVHRTSSCSQPSPRTSDVWRSRLLNHHRCLSQLRAPSLPATGWHPQYQCPQGSRRSALRSFADFCNAIFQLPTSKSG